jgi:hypothetical protein
MVVVVMMIMMMAVVVTTMIANIFTIKKSKSGLILVMP